MPNPTPRKLTHNGQTLTLNQWAKAIGISAETIRSRIDHQGWPVAKALTTPVAKKFAKRKRATSPTERIAPAMLCHKSSGRAYAKWHIGSEEHVRYFGRWKSKEASEAYRRFCAEWESGLRNSKRQPAGVCVDELVDSYLKHVESYYVKDGKQTSEVHGQHAAMRVLLSLYASLPAVEFKPKHLKACQQDMVAKKWVRATINRHTWRITRCFSWGVAEELVPAAVADALAHVPNLQAGRTDAPDPEPIMAVPPAVIEATIPHLEPVRRPVLEAMIRFHLLTGCRPGELCAMTVAAIDTSDEVWVCRVTDKNTHRQTKRKRKHIYIGPRAKKILEPFLADPGPGGRIWCFPPRWPNSTKAKRVPITTNRYSELIRKACRLAKVEGWTPHQLRHNRATEVQRIYESNKAAAIAIGDTEEVAQMIYVDPNEAVARRIAFATG